MSLPAIGALPGERRGYVDAPSGQVHYREMGAGPAIVLIHQAPWASIQYRNIMPLIAAAGYRAIAPDLPGHGLSDPMTTPTIEGFAATIPALLDALEIDRAALVGQHGGGLVAGRAAADMGARAAVLVLDNAPINSSEQRAARAGSIDDSHRVQAFGAHLMDRWSLVRRIGDPEWSDETVHVSVVTYFANGPTREHAHRAASTYDFAPDVARIACPTLILSGRRDMLFAAGAKLAALRPDWSYREYDGGAAELFDRPADWVDKVLGYVSGHDIAGAKSPLDLI